MSLPRSLRAWLLDKDADASVRYRVLRDLLDRPEDDGDVRRVRDTIGRKGWAAKILREQHPSGQWSTARTTARDLYVPKYVATNWRLIVLSDLGVPGAHPRIRKALGLQERRWNGWGGRGGVFGGHDSEACITGNAVRYLTRFGRFDHPTVQRSVDWLLDHQKSDGGWHCFRSATGTFDAWEPLAAFAEIPPSKRSAAVQRSIERGAEFFLGRGLLKEGDEEYAPWLRLHYPVHYYYDFLLGLDMLTSLGYADDRRLRPALNRLESMRNPDGSWSMGPLHPDTEDPNYQPRGPMYPLALEVPGKPSRWLTTTALTVLARAGR